MRDGVDGGAMRTYHVGTLGDDLDAGLDEGLGLLARDLVLGGAGERDVDLLEESPGTRALVVGEAVLEGRLADEGGEVAAGELEGHDGLDVGLGVAGAVGGDERALGVGEGEDGAAELDDLERGVLGDVAGAGDGDERRGLVERVLGAVLGDHLKAK